jgi:hypothetical protein
MKLLIENGANRFVKASVGKEKWTPLKIARFTGQSEEVIELLKHGIVSEEEKEKEKENENDEEKVPEEENEDDKSRKGVFNTATCDSCRCVSAFPSHKRFFNISLTQRYSVFGAFATIVTNVLITTYVGNVILIKSWSISRTTFWRKRVQNLRIHQMMRSSMMHHRIHQIHLMMKTRIESSVCRLKRSWSVDRCEDATRYNK